MAQFNEANSVRDFVRDLLKSIDISSCRVMSSLAVPTR